MKNKRKAYNRKGFTLVELVVILAIMGILIGVGAAGFTGYQKYAHFKRNNEYAQTMYTSAQTSFTHAKASGELEDVAAEMADMGDHTYSFDMVQNGVTEGTRSTSDRLYYMMFNKGEDRADYTGAKKVVYNMVASYVYDAAILDATFCVEFDPVDGIILGVCYDDTATSFSYTGGDGKTVDDISDRSVEARKPQLLGYYGADSLSARTPETIGKNTIKECTLVNGETLHVEWQLQPKYAYMANALGYELKVYDADANGELMTITVKPGTLKSKTSTNKGDQNTKCEVTITKNGQETIVNNQQFSAYVQNNKLYLDLDAVDLSIAGEAPIQKTNENFEKTNGFKNSYSIQRFGITSQQNLKVRVRTISTTGGKGRWSGYSETQNAMFGNSSLKNAESYTIANARHLYNIRFVEKNTMIPNTLTYEQNADFNWSGKNSILDNGNVYSAQVAATSSSLTYSFPSITSLKDGHTYDGSKKIIGGLVITPINEQKQDLGVFGTNNGTIKNATLKDIKVIAEKVSYVGGFCGQNNGTLTNDSVTGISEVSGKGYVGGIAGYQNKNVKIEACSNNGYIHGKDKYIGGIVGYNDLGSITKCVSIPTLSDEQLVDLQADTTQPGVTSKIMTAVKAGEMGQYVGGIVGYQASGTLSECSTGTSKTRGYVIGSKYVGGIAGGQESNTFDGTGMANYAYVIGQQYVGGITGENKEGTTLSNWKNYGMATATATATDSAGYSGGITGENAGTITQCTTQVDTNTTSGETYLEKLRLWGSTGDYSGGIAGDNSGSIQKSTNVRCVLYGHNYVGGIAGANSGSIDSDCALDGGYIEGNDCVGGFVGSNTSDKLFGDEILIAKPNLVQGNDYVGGLIGRNEIAPSILITAKLQADNFLGKVIGKHYVGGLIGGNNVSSSGTFTIGTDATTVNRLSAVQGEYYVGGVIGYDNSTSNITIQNYENNCNVSAASVYTDADGIKYSYVGGIVGLVSVKTTVDRCSNASSAKITGHGKYTGGIAERNYGKVQNCTVASLGSSSTDYIGGIVGRNETSASITNSGVTGTVTGRSYVGGIVADNYGTVTGKSVANGTVSGSGDYIGGIAGDNNGTIENIIISTSISSTGNYVGGLTGRNEGTLTSCTNTAGVTVRGGNYVGGFIGEQAGANALTGMTNNANVVATKGNAGGVVGYISGNGTITNCQNNGNVTAQQGNAGGVTASNEAIISDCKNYGEVRATNGEAGGIAAVNGLAKSGAAQITNAKVEGSVIGKTYTGAVVARNYGTVKDTTINNVSVSNSSGTVKSWIGGVAGKNESTGTIESCNVGTISQPLSISVSVSGSNAGGVTGENAGSITASASGSASTVYAKIAIASTSKASANLGGVVGYNTKNLSGYTFTGTVSGNKGNEYGYGGIVGYNASGASVSACATVNSQITATGDASDEANIGGIAGYNAVDAAVRNSSIKNTKVSTSGNAMLGGIVGHNSGMVGSETTVANGDVYTDNSSIVEISTGHIGGIVGMNDLTGTVNYVTNNATVTASGHATDNGTGGIIGYNCSTKDLTYNTNNGYVKKKVSGSNAVGGLIGRQETQNSSSYRFAFCKNTGTIEGTARVSGMVGIWKYQGGHVENCENTGQIISGTSAGGMAGELYEMTGGTSIYFNNCKNHGWICAASSSAGIVGYVSTLSSGGINMQINMCVNTGMIGTNTSASDSGGIAGNIKSGKSYVTLSIDKCRNYGTTYVAGNNFGGIISNTSGGSSVSLTNCFGVTDNKNNASITTSNLDNIDDSYYFIQNQSDTGETTDDFQIKSANFSKSSNTNSKNMYDGVKSEASMVSVQPSDGADNITIQLSKPIKLGELEIYWRTSTAFPGRTYKYNIYYNNNGSWTQIAENVVGTSYHSGTIASAQEGTVTPLDNVESDQIKIEITKGNDNTNGYISLYEIIVRDSNGNGPREPSTPSTETDKGKGTPLQVSKNTEGSDYMAAGSGVVIERLSQNPLNITDTKSDYPNDRRDAYEAIDSQLVTVYTNPAGTEKLNNPENVKLAQKDGYYEVSWDKDVATYYYEVTVRICNTDNDADIYEEKTYVVANGSSLRLDVDSDWSGKYIGASVQAISADPQLNSDVVAANDGNLQLIQPFLPIPQVHYELQGTSNYIPILDNPEDYEGHPVQISISINGAAEKLLNAGTFATDASKNSYSGNASNVVLKVYAKTTDGSIANSKTAAYQTTILPVGTMNSTHMASVGEKGFVGVTPDSLAYQLKLIPNGKEAYYRSEFLVEDDTFGLVAISSAVARVTASNTAGTVVSMTNLPESVSQQETQVYIRSYLWHSQNDVAYYSWYKQKGVTKDQITGNPDIYNAGQLNPGYSVEQVGTDLYDVIYSPILANSTIETGGTTSGYYAKQVLSSGTWPVNKPSVAATPEINTTLDESVDTDGTTKYTFKWDTGIEPSALYAVSIMATPVDGTDPVEVYAEENTTQHEVTVGENDWRYKKLTIKVTHLGMALSTYTTILGSSATQVYPVKVDLPAVTGVGVALDSKDDLDYTVTWSGISKTSEEDTDFDNDFAGYQLQIKDLETLATTIYPTDGTYISADSTDYKIDLNAFQGHKIQIAVLAKATAAASVYKDANPSDFYELNVPNRLEKPEATSDTLQMNQKPSDIMSVADFVNQGVTVTMEGDASYQIEAAIYSDSTLTTKVYPSDADSVIASMDGGSYTFDDLSSDFAGYYMKARVRSVSSSDISSEWSDEVTMQLPMIQADYADIMEAQTTEISEETDTTTTTEGTAEIKNSVEIAHDSLTWAPVDYVQNFDLTVKTADINSSGEQSYNLNIVQNVDLNNAPIISMESPKVDTSTQKNIWYDLVSTTETSTPEEDEVNNNHVITYRYPLQLTYTDETNTTVTYGYDRVIEGTTTNEDGTTTNYSIPVQCYLEYVVTAPKDGADSYYEYRLVFPDVTSDIGMQKVYGIAYPYTQEATIVANPSDDTRYVTSKMRKWYRTTNDYGEPITKIDTVE